MPEGVDYPPDTPSIGLVDDRLNLASSCLDCLFKYGIRIFDHQHHSYCASAERLRAEVKVFRRFVRDPELCPADRHLCYNQLLAFPDPEQYFRPKRSVIELHSTVSFANRQHGRYEGPLACPGL